MTDTDPGGAASTAVAGSGGSARARLRPSLVDVLNLGFVAVLAVVAAAGSRDATALPSLAAFWGAALALTAVGVAVRRSPASDAGAWYAFAYPVAVLFLLFESLFVLIPAVREARYDAELAALDRLLLGVDATLWMERYNRPWIDEVLHVCYVLYFPMPLVTLTWLFLRRRYREVEHCLLVYLLCYYVCYLLYVAVPAAGPGPWFGDRHTVPLDGVALTRPIRALIAALEPSKVDAFPSVHAAILTTTLIVTRWYSRRVFLWFLPLAAGIAVSLVYTRHHYVVDVVAGVAVALATTAVARRLSRRLGQRGTGRVAPHFPPRRPARRAP